MVEEAIYRFNRAIIDATHDLVCAYKTNIAFYEAYGTAGISALVRTINYIHRHAPKIPVILDAKRGDIANTNLGYVTSAFDVFNADAVTVSPYVGQEALQPFFECKSKGIFILCKTSNPGAGEFQDRMVELSLEEATYLGIACRSAWGTGRDNSDGDPGLYWEIPSIPFYQFMAYRVARHWNNNNNCGLVVGATYPRDLNEVRRIVGNMPILIPGIGTQDGELAATVIAGIDNKRQGIIVNASRSIIFASKGIDFADAARKKTEKLQNEINHIISGVIR